MNLTEHFTLSELLASQTASEKRYTEQFTPPQEVINNLRNLCINVLEPLRALVGKPIIITSGYRCERVNGSVPGSATHSQHLDGMAADTHVEGMTIEEWYQFIKHSGIVYDQLIQEHDLWAHVSFDGHKEVQRKQNLRATGTIEAPVYVADNS